MSWTKEIDQVLSLSGDPELAHSQWKRIEPLVIPSLKGHPGTRFLLHLMGNSRFLVDLLLKEPNSIQKLIESPYLTKPKGQEEMTRELEALSGQKTNDPIGFLQKVLRRYKDQELTRIAIRDLSGLGSFEEIGSELSCLARAEVDLARRVSLQSLAKGWTIGLPFVVIALGKLGGGDLNFSSDIDLMYVYDVPGDLPSGKGPEHLFEFFVKASEVLTHLLAERSEDGIAFRVDLNLRPEGKNGPLVNSLEALETYYEIFGSQWERTALLKALPITGSKTLSREFLKTIEPFIYRKALDQSITIELKEMKSKINRELKKNPKRGFHVKLGIGGIREIEFFLTAFQIVYGGKEPVLRERNSLAVLKILKKKGIVPPRDADHLREAYIFLRRIENRLQMVDDRQVHTLPTEEQELLSLARRMGFEDRMTFLQSLKEQTRFVEECFERLSP